MTFRLKALSSAAIVVAAPFGTAAPAFAQATDPSAAPAQTAAAPADQTSDIIVTATRQETLLQNTPVAITALSANTLRERAARDLTDVGNYTPNLVVAGRANQGSNQGEVAIRGIGSDAPDSAPSVGLYIDDVYYPSTFGNLLGLFDVQRVEVLRGPQGTLFGRNTIAGAIQYVSNKPSTEGINGFAEARGGIVAHSSALDYQFQGGVNVPITSTLAVRVAGEILQQGGYVHDELTGVDRGRQLTKAGRVQLRWKPIDGVTVDLKGETVSLTGNGRAANLSGFTPGAPLFVAATSPFVLGPFAETRPFLPSYIKPYGSYESAGFNGADFFRLRYTAANAVVAYDITDAITIKSISGYSFSRTHSVADFDDSPLAIDVSDRGVDHVRLFTEELQVAGHAFDNHLKFTGGLYYYNSVDRNYPGGYASIGRIATPPTPIYRIKTVSKAAYAQATVDIVSGVSITGGLRYSKEDVDATYPQGVGPSSSRGFSDTSPYAGVNWQVDPDILLYAKASKGFRAGGYHLDVNLPGGALFFGPETAWTYEAGARLSLFDRRLRFNPTVFRTDWDNIQFVYVTFGGVPPQPIAATQNAGDARLQGVELESQLQLTSAFQLTGSFSYLDSNYTRLAPPVPGTIPVKLALADPLARAPRFKYSIGGRYTKSLGDGTRIVAALDYAWTDRQRSAVDGDQAVELPSYGLLNGSINLTPAHSPITVSVYGTNLTDKFYLFSGINFQSNTGINERTIGRPREFGTSIRVNF